MSKLAGVVLDNWKIPIFKKHLDAASYQYEPPVPFTDATSVLRVRCDWIHALQPIIQAAENECDAIKAAWSKPVVIEVTPPK